MKEETRIGTVGFERGKYFLEVEGKREELPIGIAAEEAQLKELVGQEVEVLYTEPKRFVLGLVDRKIGTILCYIRPRPLCYYPIEPWILRGVEEQVRINLAERFFEDKLIGEHVYEKLRKF